MSAPRPPQGGPPTAAPQVPAVPVADEELPPTPPDEQFWQRHSPHHEFPLSLVATVLAHLLILFAAVIIGAMVMSGWACGGPVSTPLPIDSLEIDDGGSGGTPEGEDQNNKQDVAVQAAQPVQPTPTVPDVKPVVQQTIPEEAPIDPNAAKKEEAPAAPTQSFDSMLEQAINRNTGPKGSGQGSGGSGGNTQGHANVRTRRIQRWVLQFDYGSPREYLRQLHLIGAKLGLAKPGSKDTVLVVNDLVNMPATFQEVTVGSINQIFWRDNNPRSVISVSQVLGVPPPNPPIFYAFMPQELEQEMLDKELAYGKRFGRLKEEDFAETVFSVDFIGQKPRITVIEQRGVNDKPGTTPPKRGRR